MKSLRPCPQCLRLVSPDCRSCPGCGRPDPLRKRAPRIAQFSAVTVVVIVGIAMQIGGGLVFQTATVDVKGSGIAFALLGLIVALLGIGGLLHVARLRDW